MAKPAKLTIAFLRAHPVEAAQVLESANANEANALFEPVPARIVANVLAQMQPVSAARWLVALDGERAAEILDRFDAQPAVAALRHVEEPHRSRLIEGLPASTALATRLLLGYPDDSVGAQVDHLVVALLPDTPATEALARVRANPGVVDRVFVVDGERRLQGTVAIAELLRATPGTHLGALAQPAVATLSANSSLESTEGHRGWYDDSVLPVVEHGQKLIGVLRRDGLERALRARARPMQARVGAGGLAGDLALGYWSGLSGILEALVTLLPVRRPENRR